jgi:hypothetical protein
MTEQYNRRIIAALYFVSEPVGSNVHKHDQRVPYSIIIPVNLTQANVTPGRSR